MGFITSAISVKKIATNLRRKKGLEKRSLRSIPQEYTERISPELLNPYIYERLYLPIVVDRVIPLKNLDISLVTEDDIEQLGEVLSHSNVHRFIQTGTSISRLHPAATDKQIFI
jgi:hypothetical protein